MGPPATIAADGVLSFIIHILILRTSSSPYIVIFLYIYLLHMLTFILQLKIHSVSLSSSCYPLLPVSQLSPSYFNPSTTFRVTYELLCTHQLHIIFVLPSVIHLLTFKSHFRSSQLLCSWHHHWTWVHVKQFMHKGLLIYSLYSMNNCSELYPRQWSIPVAGCWSWWLEAPCALEFYSSHTVVPLTAIKGTQRFSTRKKTDLTERQVPK